MSVVAYLVATNRGLNFLEHRETVNLTLQVAVAVGALLALLAGGDAVSGERERGTLESLLLSPASRLGLTAGKLLAALSCGRPPSRLRCRTSGSSAGASGSSATRS
jgi:ABC-2 type transport system permease protein